MDDSRARKLDAARYWYRPVVASSVIAFAVARYGIMDAACTAFFVGLSWLCMANSSGWSVVRIIRFHEFVLVGGVWFAAFVWQLDRDAKRSRFPVWCSTFLGALVIIDAVLAFAFRRRRLRDDEFRRRVTRTRRYWVLSGYVYEPIAWESEEDAERSAKSRMFGQLILGSLLVLLPMVFGRKYL